MKITQRPPDEPHSQLQVRGQISVEQVIAHKERRPLALARPDAPRLKPSRQAAFQRPKAAQAGAGDVPSPAARVQAQSRPPAKQTGVAQEPMLALPSPDPLPEPDPDRAFGDLLHRDGELLSILEVIQARIDAVTPLIHRTSGACRVRQGTARVKFRMDGRGYTQEHLLSRSSGSHCLDEQIEEILHLAEPYPYVAGWVPVQVKFSY